MNFLSKKLKKQLDEKMTEFQQEQKEHKNQIQK